MDKKYCKFCGEEIHPLRLEILPHTQTCVKCSNEKPKAGRIVTHGTGEEIYTEVEIISREQAEKDARIAIGYTGPLLDDPETLEPETDQDLLDE
jgi:hypothetical protein